MGIGLRGGSGKVRPELVAVALLFPSLAGAQSLYVPQGVWLEWNTARVALSPDSSGTIVWVQSTGDRKAGIQAFVGTFEAENAAAWVAAARSFLKLPLRDGDTVLFRASPRVRTADGLGSPGGMYLARRQQEGRWTEERFLVLESRDQDPVMVNANEKALNEILDSLEAVAMRTPIVPVRPVLKADSTVHTEKAVTKVASAYPDNQPPLYPVDLRRINQSGMVILSFVVGIDGKAEMSSARAVFSSHPSFLKAVLEAVPRMRFYPAEIDGRPVRQLVHMPFAFSIVR